MIYTVNPLSTKHGAPVSSLSVAYVCSSLYSLVYHCYTGSKSFYSDYPYIGETSISCYLCILVEYTEKIERKRKTITTFIINELK